MRSGVEPAHRPGRNRTRAVQACIGEDVMRFAIISNCPDRYAVMASPVFNNMDAALAQAREWAEELGGREFSVVRLCDDHEYCLGKNKLISEAEMLRGLAEERARKKAASDMFENAA